MTSIRSSRLSIPRHPQPPPRDIQTVIDVQRAFRAWRKNESALFYCPAALVPPATCGSDRERVLHVARARIGTSYWVSQYIHLGTVGNARHVAASVPAIDLLRLERDGLLLSSLPGVDLDSAEDQRAFRLPAMYWLFPPLPALRRRAASLVFQPHAPSNCVLFIYTTLYAAGCINKAQCQRALRDQTQDYAGLGFAAAQPIDTRPPQAGDILFVTRDGVPFHVALCDSDTTFVQLGARENMAPRRVERLHMNKLWKHHGTAIETNTTSGKISRGLCRVLACSLADALAGLGASP